MGKVNKPAKTIFFIRGFMASNDELAEAEQFQPGVVFRCASKVDPSAPIEPFDRVAGAVPDNYANSDGKAAPSMRKRDRRAIDRERETEVVAERGERKRERGAVPMRVPSAEDASAGPQGAAWGAGPAAAAPQAPTPPARPVWRPNA